jgi:hypothetical protein
MLCLVSCLARQERECDYRVDGMCMNTNGYEDITKDMVQKSLDIVYHFYSYQYNVSFSPAELAREADLYVVLHDFSVVAGICGIDEESGCYSDGSGNCYTYEVSGCYAYGVNEIEIGYRVEDSVGSRVTMYYLIHEMMHFWNDVFLRSARPELFGSDPDQTEYSHMIPNMFSVWCRQNPEDQCVENLVQKEINRMVL